MPFTLDSLTRTSRGARAPGGSGRVPGMFSYTTNDPHTDLVAANYWNAGAAHLSVGSTIFAAVDIDNPTPASRQLRAYMVTSISAANVVTVVQLTNS
jgi:hypothetical protein